LIAGTGGFGLETCEVLISNGIKQEDIVFFDNVSTLVPDWIIREFKVVRSFRELTSSGPFSFVIGTGNPAIRKLLFDQLCEHGGEPYSVVSNKAVIGILNTTIGRGVNIMTGTIITSDVVIEDGVLINLNVTVGHGCNIGAFSEICPGVHLSGNTHIESSVFIGTGAVILPNLRIGEGAVIAAGSIVIKDVSPYTLVAGNPAQLKKSLR